MAGENRTTTPDLTRLSDFGADPFRYELFAALRLVECVFRDAPRLGLARRPQQEPVRFSQAPHLNFPASSMAGAEPGVDGGPWRVSTYAFGLLGPNGPMPLHFTELILERWRRYRDPTLARFFDIFHHRLTTLFYRAWADAQPVTSFDRPEDDRFATYVGATCGFALSSHRGRDAFPDRTKLSFAGHLACQTRHPEGLRAMIAQFFRVPAALEEFVGQWMELPPDVQVRLGRQSLGRLGQDAVIGARVWDSQGNFRIIMGPMSLAEYESLLPGGRRLEQLRALVRNYVGLALHWDIRLVLRREEVPAPQLGGYGRLGWTTWLRGRTPSRDADQLVLRVRRDR